LSEEEKEDENKGKSLTASVRETSQKLKKIKEIIDEESNNNENKDS
jgi:hypothetical protein